MKITNKTTGDSIIRNGVTSTDANNNNKNGPSNFKGKWILDGVRTTLDGKSDTMQNDQGIITLQKETNEIQVDNFTGKVMFDFPFWWLS